MRSISLYPERDPLVLTIYALQPAKVVTGDVSVSALPGRSFCGASSYLRRAHTNIGGAALGTW